jgi:hypothetical protein
VGDADAGAVAGVFSDRRWLKLTSAISGKVQDIHKNRLKSALLSSQPAVFGNAAAAAGSSTTGDGTNTAVPGGDGSGDSSSSELGKGSSAAAGDGTAADGSTVGASAAHSSSSKQQQAAAPSNTLQLKEVIGQGSFGIVYRWV